MISLVAVILVGTFLPHTSFGQWGDHFSPKFQSMSYSIVNGKLYVDPPTTEAPGFWETWLPWWSGSYESSNPEAVDDAILDSVTGPPSQEGTTRPSVPNSFGASGYNPNQNESPYLTNDDEDNYIPSESYNIPYQMVPGGQGNGGAGGQQFNGYPNANQLPSYYMPPLPYPFSQNEEEQSTTEQSRPFYQPILDFFGYGSAEEEEEQLPFPSFPGMSGVGMNGYPSSPYAQNSFQPLPTSPSQYNHQQQSPSHPQQQYHQPLLAQQSAFVPTYAQARSSFQGDTVQYAQSSKAEGKYSVHNGPKSDLIDRDGNGSPCPKFGVWEWNGEVCIAIGSAPTWACKPSDLVMSSSERAGVFCTNKVFFPLEISLEQKT